MVKTLKIIPSYIIDSKNYSSSSSSSFTSQKFWTLFLWYINPGIMSSAFAFSIYWSRQHIELGSMKRRIIGSFYLLLVTKPSISFLNSSKLFMNISLTNFRSLSSTICFKKQRRPKFEFGYWSSLDYLSSASWPYRRTTQS